MTASTIAKAAQDPDLQARVLAMAHKEIAFNQALAETMYGKQLQQGIIGPQPLMYPVAVDTEAAYESALAVGRGAPGHDADIITDAALTSAIIAHWPYAENEVRL